MTYDATTKKKVLSYGQKYNASKAISKFEISRGTYYRWLGESQDDYVKPERKAFFCKVDPELLKACVLQHPNLTCQQIGQHFNVSGTAINSASPLKKEISL